MPGSDPLEGLGEQDGIELVQKIPLFRALTFDRPGGSSRSRARAPERRRGDRRGERDGQALYVVKRGRVRVVRDGAVIGELAEGELFGEMSLVDDLFTSARVEAESDVELVVLPRRPFELLVASDLLLAVKVYRAFCRTLSDRLRRANALLPPEQRLATGCSDMDLATFNQFLGAAVKNGASDLHFKAGVVPALRINGELRAIRVPALRPRTPPHRRPHPRRRPLARATSTTLAGGGHLLRARGGGPLPRLRVPPEGEPRRDPAGHPLQRPDPRAARAAADREEDRGEERGLILVTGITGSGKTSTLAAMVDQINQTTRKHIVTIEDPIEFLHEDRNARITQREVGPDTASFANALRAALRQDPDVILVGEMRDLETIDIALKAAETGHLVLSTAHTTDAARTIGRLLGAYPAEAQHGVRGGSRRPSRRSCSQRLLPRATARGACSPPRSSSPPSDPGVHPRSGEDRRDQGLLEKGRELYGTQTFDQHLDRALPREADHARDRQGGGHQRLRPRARPRLRVNQPT